VCHLSGLVADSCRAYDVGSAIPEDSPSVKATRQQGAANIAKWVKEYNMQKTAVPKSNPANLFNLEYTLGGFISRLNDTIAGSDRVRNQSVLQPSEDYVSAGGIA